MYKPNKDGENGKRENSKTFWWGKEKPRNNLIYTTESPKRCKIKGS